MRLFLSNPNLYFSLADMARRTKVPARSAKRELESLGEIGFVTMKKLAILAVAPSGKKKQKQTATKSLVWQLNQDFFFSEHLRSMFNADFFASQNDLADRFKNCGKVKLVVISGLFIQDGGTRADILVVGDDLRRVAIENVISTIESEIGRELIYAILDTQDYLFRLSSSDRFVRDITDYPHKRLIDRLNG